MPWAASPIAERHDLRPDALPDEILRSETPVVLRRLVADWPLVRAAREGAQAAADYLTGLARVDAPPVVVTVGPPEIAGRFFYNASLDGFNFRREQVPLPVVLRTLLNYLDDPAPPAIYVASTTIDTWLPGFGGDNAITLGERAPLASIWIGNRTRIAAHQDLPDNLACVAAGRRRVTLFPPDQLANLYVGPLDLTPAGQPISLVDFAAPDLQRFPRFAEAMRHAQVAELAAGDAVLIPSMWWHHMEGLEPFNVLVNYWWRQSPGWMDTPMDALMHALLSVRDLPPAQRAIWREVFAHYVFDPGDATAAHIPDAARGALAPLDAERARRLRARLLQRLNR
ncbi:cupin-like domain-containing protein [Luteimonas sp. S4-F44]|uniref:cupin-like domain-containing protein n=1 Tax=Luteimonas sp. S4-F44 TaxID=2925842 RepID=UPI001F53DEBB|nr:cupin-like domain-containing protein [Luteimonas sp. S4-F44]UNK42789.1 cupin-like domain-containing protein [Luteimonas sp. S4-F44]